jgi:hypothetical protein
MHKMVYVLDRVFIAFQSEVEAAASTLRQSLIESGCRSDSIFIWNPSAPWAEPIFEVGRKIVRSDVVLVISGGGRKSSWLAAEEKFAHRVRVPVRHISAAKVGQVSMASLENETIENLHFFRLLQQTINNGSGFYEMFLYEELNLLEHLAADRGRGVLHGMRRRLLEFNVDIGEAVNAFFLGPKTRLGLVDVLAILVFVIPRGLLNACVYYPLVRLAEKRGWLEKIQPSAEFGRWRDALPNAIGGSHPFFEPFYMTPVARGFLGLSDPAAMLLERIEEEAKKRKEELAQDQGSDIASGTDQVVDDSAEARDNKDA